MQCTVHFLWNMRKKNQLKCVDEKSRVLSSVLFTPRYRILLISRASTSAFMVEWNYSILIHWFTDLAFFSVATFHFVVKKLNFLCSSHFFCSLLDFLKKRCQWFESAQIFSFIPDDRSLHVKWICHLVIAI